MQNKFFWNLWYQWFFERFSLHRKVPKYIISIYLVCIKFLLTDCGNDERDESIVDKDAITDFEYFRDVLVVHPDSCGVTLVSECLISGKLYGLSLREFNLSGTALYIRNRQTLFAFRYLTISSLMKSKGKKILRLRGDPYEFRVLWYPERWRLVR